MFLVMFTNYLLHIIFYPNIIHILNFTLTINKIQIDSRATHVISASTYKKIKLTKYIYIPQLNNMKDVS